MFKTEAHMHTYPVSSCSKLSPRELIRLHKAAGYDTVIISDHFAPHHFKKLGEDKSFAEKVGILYDAYLEAKDEGEQLGMIVLFSVELTLHSNHYLLYGVTKDFLLLREDIFALSLDQFYDHAKSHGITIIQAHPFRDGKCTPHPHHVDGFEGINSNPRHEDYNDRALAIAREYGMPVSCGSDAHRVDDVGVSATLSEEKITSVEQYLDLLNSGKLLLSVNGEIVCSSL